MNKFYSIISVILTVATFSIQPAYAAGRQSSEGVLGNQPASVNRNDITTTRVISDDIRNLRYVPVVSITTPPNPVGLKRGQSKSITYSLMETGNASGEIISHTYQFYTQYGVPLSEPLGPYPISIEVNPLQATEWNELVFLPESVVNKARSVEDYAMVLKTTFKGKSSSGAEFSAQASLLLILPPSMFGKVTPANNALIPASNQSLQWNSSVGATDYQYCFDTINNNKCDTSWHGTYDTHTQLTSLLVGTKYYWQVRANNMAGTIYADNGVWWSFTTSSAKVQVILGGSNLGNYTVSSQNSLRISYPGINNGPVRVTSTNGVSLVASERVAYSPNGGTTWTSYSELMGLPSNQLSSSYTFPFYNNVDINSQLRFGNVGTVNTTVTVTIAGVIKGSYNLAPNASQRVSYAGLNAGPVKITSSGNVPIIASLRVAYFNGTAWTSFSEMMGLPSGQLTNGYIFPWYNNLDLNSQLRFANVGTVNTTVTVTIGGVVRGSYTLIPNESKRVNYPALDKGPVKITSSSNVPIIASMRVAYFDGSAWTDFSEMMGLPSSSLSTHYSFPRYNNINLNSQLRFGNAGNTTTTVTVTIGGVLKGSYMLAPNESKRVSYAGLDAGPVVIQSSGGVPIIASERVAYFNGSAWTSFAEMMGLPQAQLTTTYLFPWYNNVDLNTQLRFGIP
ncbi:MAG: hypothetical protein ABIU06_01000 [Anaerolineales bacterium]